MLRQLDELLLDKVFQPLSDLASDRLETDCLSLAFSALIGSGVMLFLVAMAPFPFGPPGHPARIIPCIAWAGPFLSVYWDIQDAARLASEGTMNRGRLRDRSKRIITIIMLGVFPPLVPILPDAVPPYGSPAPLWQLVAYIALFLGLFATAQYLVACAPRPPRSRRAEVRGKVLSVPAGPL